MKPELRRVVLGLMIAAGAFAIVLAIARVHPADLAAPGLTFVSPGSLANRTGSPISAAGCGVWSMKFFLPVETKIEGYARV
jgi:hypothetical protein